MEGWFTCLPNAEAEATLDLLEPFLCPVLRV